MNKYEIVGIVYGGEVPISTEEYECKIILELRTIDGVVPNFFKDITVLSHNKLTGFEVDSQREIAIAEFLEMINK